MLAVQADLEFVVIILDARLGETFVIARVGLVINTVVTEINIHKSLAFHTFLQGTADTKCVCIN